MLKLTTDKHEASRSLSATAELLVLICYNTQISIFIMCTFMYDFNNNNNNNNNSLIMTLQPNMFLMCECC